MDSDFANIPNEWALQASDFDFDPVSYIAALGFLGDVSVGVAEDRALTTNGGTAELRRSWESSRRFRRALGKAREMGETERAWDERRAAAMADPFSVPPHAGIDLAAVEYDPQVEEPRGGLGGWLRSLGRAFARQSMERQRQAPAGPPGQRFTPVSEMTDSQWLELNMQRRPLPQQPRSVFTRTPEPGTGL